MSQCSSIGRARPTRAGLRRAGVLSIAGMTALATMLIKMRADEAGVAPEETVAEVGRRIQELLPGCD